MTKQERDELRRVAEATAGDPICKDYMYSVLRYAYKSPSAFECSEDDDCAALDHPNHRDVDFFAAFDPPTALALLVLLDEKDAEIERLQALFLEPCEHLNHDPVVSELTWCFDCNASVRIDQ